MGQSRQQLAGPEFDVFDLGQPEEPAAVVDFSQHILWGARMDIDIREGIPNHSPT